MISPVMPVYKRSSVRMVRGEGVYLWDADGRRYLDFAAGIAVNALGHCHPQVAAALARQADTLWHCSNMFMPVGLEDYSIRLVEATFADTVFLCNSGAEAVECGLKMIRKYHDAAGRPERFRVITFEGAFHGRTLATISAGKSARVLAGYEPAVDGFDQVPFGDLAAVERMIAPQTGGILVEAVQGDGGIRPQTPAFMQGLRKLADKHGLLLMIDEVQSGFGRTGTFFAFEQYGVMPDIVAAGKGIGNGFPLAACLATEKAASCMTPGSHGSTYGSNPLATAVGAAVLEIMLAPGFLAHVVAMGAALRMELEKLAAEFPAIFCEVRGMGLMLALVTAGSCEPVVKKLRDAGLLTAPAAGNAVRFLPPLIIVPEHIDEAVAILHRVCKEWNR